MAECSLRKELHEANRLSWNEATRAHNSHKGDQIKFFKDGGSTLFAEETELLGTIADLSLVHLQCNAGQDTLSLARLGATVTGVDISDEAIAFAQQLSEQSGIPATFYRADLFDWFADSLQQGRQYDIAFSSYGAICWLSNLKLWAKGVASVLKPNGRLVMIDFHPAAMIFDEDWNHAFPYFADDQPMTWNDGVGDYVAESRSGLSPDYQAGIENFQNPHPSHEFQWSIGDILTALLEAGLTLKVFKEYPYSNGWKPFKHMQETPDRRMFPPPGRPSLPLMYGLVAQK